MKYLTFTAVGTIHNVANAIAIVSYEIKNWQEKKWFYSVKIVQKKWNWIKLISEITSAYTWNYIYKIIYMLN